jgi:hypothetical protein
MVTSTDIKNLKYLRLLPIERYIIDLFVGITVTQSNQPDWFIYSKNETVLFRYNQYTKILYLNYYTVTDILEQEFNLELIDIRNIIKAEVEKLFNIPCNRITEFYIKY